MKKDRAFPSGGMEADDGGLLYTGRTWAEIDLDAIRNNVERARAILAPGTKIAAVLKADAYGLGALRVAETLIGCGVEMLAVACLSEALEIRNRFHSIPVLVMGYTPDDWLGPAVSNDITLTVFSVEQARLLSREAVRKNREARIHIKIDTGFNRLGIKAGEGAAETVREIAECPRLKAEGIFTHLALNSREDDEAQFSLFMKTVAQAEALGVHFPLKHVCDSIGLVRYPEFQLDMVRPGAFLYGMTSDRDSGLPLGLRFPLTLKTRLARVAVLQKGEGVGYDRAFVAQRACRMGTLCAGYADGYPRSLSGKGRVLIRSKNAPLIGLMCMDQCMVDLSDIPEAKPGDEAILIGGTENGGIPPAEVARNAGTNKNEVLCRLGRRVPRIYYSGSRAAGVADYLSRNG